MSSDTDSEREETVGERLRETEGPGQLTGAARGTTGNKEYNNREKQRYNTFADDTGDVC